MQDTLDITGAGYKYDFIWSGAQPGGHL